MMGRDRFRQLVLVYRPFVLRGGKNLRGILQERKPDWRRKITEFGVRSVGWALFWIEMLEQWSRSYPTSTSSGW
ncbi:hypothetical protein [Rubritalea tangerina]|uniref:hypothetical protein n=1 Tax=Rubritalea tangerina TaxID=430798 RepID=UPI0036229114